MTMRPADEVGPVAEQERPVADLARQDRRRRDPSEREHFRAMKAHERSAELYDAIARLRRK
jgi:hypothetical protein